MSLTSLVVSVLLFIGLTIGGLLMAWGYAGKSSKAKAWFSQPLRSEKKREASAAVLAPLVREEPTTSPRQFKCPKCEGNTKEVAAGIYCFKCDLLLDGTGQPLVPKIESKASEIKPPAPPVGERDVWVPILWLVGMIFLGFFSWVLGLLGLIGAAIYVHYDAKKYGVESHAWLTLLFAIIGLPLHANELHKLRRAQQTGQVRTLVEAGAPAATVEPQPSVSGRIGAEDHGDIAKEATKFCRKCGAKIPRDSRFCEECGAGLVEAGPLQTPRESSVPRKRTWSKSTTIGLLLVLLVVVWAVFPVFVRDPSPILLLTSTGSGGRYTLRLQNLSPWPMVVNGYWGFSPSITWSDSGPSNDFTLMPFTVYTFDYMMYCAGLYCLGGETAPYVTFTGDVTLLYRTYQVSIRSTNYGR